MKPCIVCGSLNTEKWSMNRGRELSIVDLCPEHEGPLLEVFRAGLVQDEKPTTGRTPSQRMRPSKEKLFAPLEWEPPGDKGSST